MLDLASFLEAASQNAKKAIRMQCFPMAYLVENADGKAITGKEKVLDISPTAIHERRPIFLGSADDVDAVEKLYLS